MAATVWVWMAMPCAHCAASSWAMPAAPSTAALYCLGPLPGNPTVAGHPTGALTGARHVPFGSDAAAGAGLVGRRPPAVSKKKCFSIALGHTLVVLEMH